MKKILITIVFLSSFIAGVINAKSSEDLKMLSFLTQKMLQNEKLMIQNSKDSKIACYYSGKNAALVEVSTEVMESLKEDNYKVYPKALASLQSIKNLTKELKQICTK